MYFITRLFYQICKNLTKQLRIQDFLLGGADPLGGSTSDTCAFWQKHV